MVPTILLAAMLGCGSDAPPPAAQPKPAQPVAPGAPARKAPVKAKAKTGNLSPQGGTRRGKAAPVRGGRGAPGGAALPPPVGAPGPVKATLVLDVTAAQVPPVAPPAEVPQEPTPAEEGVPPVQPPAPEAPIPAGQAAPQTTATMKLSWGDGQSTEASLGSVEGTCRSVEPKPVGPAGRERIPMWTVACEHDGATSELYILQIASLLAVVKGTPTGDETKPMAYKPVRKVRLVPGAQLQREG